MQFRLQPVDGGHMAHQPAAVPIQLTMHNPATTLEQVMTAAKQNLRGILDQFDRHARCVYIDYPVHTNVGDLLINLGSEAFFASHNLHIWRRYSIFDFPHRIAGLDDEVVLLMHGGGNFGDIWPEHQLLREHVLERYPRNRTIFLPQTVYYNSPQCGKSAAERLAKHGNLHVYVRDLESLERLQYLGLRSVSAMPDMAHWLQGDISPRGQSRRTKPLVLIRTDKEAAPIPEDLRSVARYAIDWDDLFPLLHKIMWRSSYELIRRTGGLKWPCQQSRFWYQTRDLLIGDGIRAFSEAKAIFTNRLHAVILGLLLGRKITWFDNAYGKLSSYIDCWLSASPNVTRVGPLTDAEYSRSASGHR